MTIHRNRIWGSFSLHPGVGRRRREKAEFRPIVPCPRFRPLFDVMEDRTLLSDFIVINTSDSGPGSLRQAILSSNAASGVTNHIDFAIPGPGVHTIALASPLPQ